MDPMNIIVTGLLIAVLVYLISGGKSDPEAIKKAISDGWTVLDVRSAGEFGSGHAKGARNIPVDQLGVRHEELERKQVIVYCASGMRSRRAASILKQAGFEVVDAGTQASLR